MGFENLNILVASSIRTGNKTTAIRIAPTMRCGTWGERDPRPVFYDGHRAHSIIGKCIFS